MFPGNAGEVSVFEFSKSPYGTHTYESMFQGNHEFVPDFAIATRGESSEKRTEHTMKKALRIHATLAAAFLALVLPYAARADHGASGKGNDQTQEVRLRARLTGQAIATITPEGSGDFRSESSDTRLSVEVEHVNLPAGTVLAVFIQSGTNAPVQVGTITLSATGFGELELDSDHGALVPAVQNGDVLSVSNAGTTILAGVFGPA